VRFGSLFSLIYLVVGVLVAAGVLGSTDYFADVNGLLGILEVILVILLWPLVLLGVDINLGGGVDVDLDVGDDGSAGGGEGGGGKEGDVGNSGGGGKGK